MKFLYLLALLAASALAADQALLARGKKEETRSCIACHSLRIIRSQRLSKAAWNRELDKMAGWGAVVTDRDALLEYFVENFGDAKPPQPISFTQDDSSQLQK